jgi:hypothetical protein
LGKTIYYIPPTRPTKEEKRRYFNLTPNPSPKSLGEERTAKPPPIRKKHNHLS